MRHIGTEAIVEENKVRLKAAERMITEGEPLVAIAAEEVAAAEERRKRIERGESVSLPGKVPTLKELGITPAHAEYMIAVSQLAPEQFERFLNFGGRRVDYARRDYARLGASCGPKQSAEHDRPPPVVAEVAAVTPFRCAATRVTVDGCRLNAFPGSPSMNSSSRVERRGTAGDRRGARNLGCRSSRHGSAALGR
jgi:hypothetical protein